MPHRQIFSFGDCELHLPGRVLLRGGAPVRLGDRALDILVALVLRAGQLVGRDELLAEVWPNTTVDDGALRVHMSGLRRALGDGQAGARYIVNHVGRGYRLVAPVSWRAVGDAAKPAAGLTPALPVSLDRVIGRAEVVEQLAARVAVRRLVTVVGPGGIGKTTVALALSRRLAADGDMGASFVDFSPVTDAQRLPAALAAGLGLAPSPTDDSLDEVFQALRDGRQLLVLDNCEHVVEAAAALVEQLLKGCPDLTILATSREPLRAEGEWVHRLASLSVPPVTVTDPDAIRRHSAVAMFLDRAAAGDGLETGVDALMAVAAICRRLDGIPLAIELAAARIGRLEARALMTALNERFTILGRGRRTAPPRQETLRATLDWSFDLLRPEEQTVLIRLSVFRSSFDIRAAMAIAASEEIDELAVMDAVSELVAKSMITMETVNGESRYALLAVTRQYAHDRLADQPGHQAVHRAHALYCRRLFADLEPAWSGKAPIDYLERQSRHVDDIRAALDWALGSEGDPAISLSLIIAIAPLWFHLSLQGEILDLAQRAVEAAAGQEWGETAQHGELLVAYGHAVWHARGPTPAMAQAFEQAEALGRRLQERPLEMRALWGRWAQKLEAGDYADSLALADRFADPARRMGDMTSVQSADHMRALSLHFLGDQPQAQALVEGILRRDQAFLGGGRVNHARVDSRLTLMTSLARIHWLRGDLARAAEAARYCAAESQRLEHDLTACFGLALGAIPVALWLGDHDWAAHLNGVLRQRTAGGALRHWDAWAQGYACVLGQETALSSATTGKQVDMLATLGWQPALHLAASRGGAWCQPELMRHLALARAAEGAVAEADALLQRAAQLADRQGALSWSLRIAISQARLWHDRQRTDAALAQLRDVRGRFGAGDRAGDLKIADDLLETLRGAVPQLAPHLGGRAGGPVANLTVLRTG
ncbi:ATP-binding protein [Nitrospirillum iridis]|uniref:Putative ATPase/DNA-binding winged helix-turn-helix (WHTH) protein n=1 Tax=Nitrospirillum iridis TaxID=765888 RepID=A0A7X0AXQ5_9PROT|nr:winged helix-turn-helix domain-containing protein [Nitrospirillum iridis]MBB6252063.1 putative ATPase/DNA-binding winged helix-turn-helix (wHTH) protein [Nitrospirillum iridis]